MAYKTFKNWLLREGNDIFGFERESSRMNEPQKKSQNDKPVNPLNLEEMTTILSSHSVGTLEPYMKFIDEVHWGKGSGAIRICLGTGLNVMIERQILDLHGIAKWITKEVYQIDQVGMGGHERQIAEELLQRAEHIYNAKHDSARNDYKDLEMLTIAVANAIKKTARPIFIFEGVRKVNPDNYIVRFSVRGHGVEAQDKRRVEENQTYISYDKDTGLIRMFNYNIESSVGRQHSWEIMPTDTDWYFCPTQSKDEVVETIANTMHWY